MNDHAIERDGNSADEGLASLLTLACLSTGADYCLAFEVGPDQVATPLAANPLPLPPSFPWRETPERQCDWTAGPIDVGPLRLPISVTLAPGRPARRALLVDIPNAAARTSMLLLWTKPDGSEWGPGQIEPIRLVRTAIAGSVAARNAQRQQVEERFHDLFESVPLGIVAIDGEGEAPVINKRAASLLGLPPGLVGSERLASAMRALRERSGNADELAARYETLQGELNYSTTLIWQMESESIQVDTHPILGDGRNGRIWIFNDVTAQQRIEQDLRRLADRDALTGLSNRRHFELVGTSLFTASRNRGEAMSLLMIDIDYFKAINDQYGHAAGDYVLRAVATRLRNALREEDMIARMGGEEFACILAQTDADAAAAVAERLRTAIEMAPVVSGVQAIDARVSVGAASRTGRDQSLGALLDRADQALYGAKRGGRNRVVVAT